MKARLLPRFRALGFTSVAALAATLLFWHGQNSPPLADVPAWRSDQPPSRVITILPFTFAQVLDYFRESLGEPAEQDSTHALFRGGTPTDNGYVILVATQGPDLLVRFKAADDYGMNMVREFFEAPFFAQDESEQFYTLLYLGDGVQTKNFPRFDLVFDYREQIDSVLVSLMFAPPGRYRTILSGRR